MIKQKSDIDVYSRDYENFKNYKTNFDIVMKIKSIILSAFAILAFASCSNDNDSSNGGTNPGSNVEQGYLSVSLASPSASSFRTTGSVTKPSVAPNDSKINSVTILLVSPKGTDNAGKILQIFNDADFTLGATPTTDHSFRANVGDYEVYAIVNPSGAFVNSFQVGKDIEQVLSLTENQEQEAIQGYASSSNGFLMTNERNQADVTAGIPVKITTESTISNPAKAAIKVDRLVAALQLSNTTPSIKFQESTGDATSSTIMSSAKILGFVPLYARKDFNSIQTWEESTEKGTVILKNPSATVTPESSSTAKFYNRAEDLLKYNGNIAVSSKVDTTEFNKLSYVLENRPEIVTSGDVLTSYNIGTTAVVFAVQASNSAGENKTFYKVSQSNKYFYDVQAAIAERNNFYTDKLDTATTNPEDLRAKGIKVYEDGLVYYTYYIKDKNHSVNGLNYNAVHRNSIYELNVTNLYSIGDDLPGGNIPDPSKPELIIDSYLSVSISINDWVLNDYDIEL